MFQKRETLGLVGRKGLRNKVYGRRKEPLDEASFMESPEAMNSQAAAQQLVQRMAWAKEERR